MFVIFSLGLFLWLKSKHMFKNLVKTAIRHILKHPGYSFLNVLGLTQVITFATISYKAYQAAVTNPADSVRTE